MHHDHAMWWITADALTACLRLDAGRLTRDRPKCATHCALQGPIVASNVASAKNANSVAFTACPSIGRPRCQVNFNENSDGLNYSLRVSKHREDVPIRDRGAIHIGRNMNWKTMTRR
ncbi:hypothetical protein C8Q80DRAFT_677404 [Daedaleopsis nitida]|nr:hypothetical protein C8Q80DRAFT_677404 [Daedaleopsis nitida]